MEDFIKTKKKILSTTATINDDYIETESKSESVVTDFKSSILDANS